MKNIIFKGFLTCFGAMAGFAPFEAEALKIKVQPSLSFSQSYGNVYTAPAPSYYVRPAPVVQQVYVADPYFPAYQVIQQPAPVAYYYPAPIRHYRTHSHSTNFGLSFKFR